MVLSQTSTGTVWDDAHVPEAMRTEYHHAGAAAAILLREGSQCEWDYSGRKRGERGPYLLTVLRHLYLDVHKAKSTSGFPGSRAQWFQSLLKALSGGPAI